MLSDRVKLANVRLVGKQPDERRHGILNVIGAINSLSLATTKLAYGDEDGDEYLRAGLLSLAIGLAFLGYDIETELERVISRYEVTRPPRPAGGEAAPLPG